MNFQRSQQKRLVRIKSKEHITMRLNEVLWLFFSVIVEPPPWKKSSLKYIFELISSLQTTEWNKINWFCDENNALFCNFVYFSDTTEHKNIRKDHEDVTRYKLNAKKNKNEFLFRTSTPLIFFLLLTTVQLWAGELWMWSGAVFEGIETQTHEIDYPILISNSTAKQTRHVTLLTKSLCTENQLAR